MRAYLSVFLIFIVYVISGFLLGASPFKTYFPSLSVILGGIALALAFMNGRKIQESRTIMFWLFWIVFTSFPGILFILFMKSNAKSFLFPWQLGIWGIYVPAIIMIVQAIYMIVLRVIAPYNTMDTTSTSKLLS
ncbi:hypothetical protein [Pontibacillus marinus]|uniref:Uncharacterized protein n=1 Tax=Pontibacillus marinus BH030004 = DSM 16465 TaxID=1385511 RepID=A0A0A5I158_9BACI|nr:hypothetical protein [Pontibacillus marinus]KGX89592.1 hypothetical protein N783_05560 [Pontibacillus marinus BH030004 = DSM 16465]